MAIRTLDRIYLLIDLLMASSLKACAGGTLAKWQATSVSDKCIVADQICVRTCTCFAS